MEQLLTFAANNQMLSMMWLAIVSMLVFITVKSKLSKVKEVNTQELTMLVNREDGVIVDIRKQQEFNKGHIIGSKNISAEKIDKNDIAALENAKSKPIIVVCTAGLSAVKAANKLTSAGFEKVFVLKGGFSAWQSASLPVAK